jgi:hypothetical protein
MEVREFLRMLVALAKRYKVKVHPKQLDTLTKTFDNGGQFDCIVANRCIVVVRSPE